MPTDIKTLRTGVFIDGSNLFWAMKERHRQTGAFLNYTVCFTKLKALLETHYSPVFFNYYACEDLAPTREPYIARAAKQKMMLNKLAGMGYSVNRKALKHIGQQTKCDTDVEITMAMHKFVNDYDNIVIFTGDSDFLGAVEYFHSLGKHIRIYSFGSSLAWELKQFCIDNPRCIYILLDELKAELEYVYVPRNKTA